MIGFSLVLLEDLLLVRQLYVRTSTGRWPLIEILEFKQLVQTAFIKVFYLDNLGINKNEVDVAEYNFDHPLALDFDLAYQVLRKLKYTNE